MKITGLFTAFFCFLLISCNTDRDRKLSDAEMQELKKKSNDSIVLVLDSIYRAEVAVPPLFELKNADTAVMNTFGEMANKTNGELKILVSSKLILNEIKHIIEKNAVDKADILFLIDKTGSMEDDIQNIQAGLTQIINSISRFRNIRVGIGLYGDKNSDGADWFSFRNFETDLNKAKEFIDRIQVTNGNDYPESVYDGFFEVMRQNFWKSEDKRMILLIGDAPPLEKPLSDYSMPDVISKATAAKVTMNFYPIVVMPVLDEFTETAAPQAFRESKLIASYYPNPSAGRVSINFQRDDEYEVQIFNSSGSLIASKRQKGINASHELYNYPDGVYIIRVIDAKGRYETVKMMLKK